MIELLEQSHDNRLAFRISGKVSKEEEKEWIKRFENIIERYGKFRVMVILDESAKWGIEAGIDDLKFAISHVKNFEKLAIISTSKVMKTLVAIDAFFASFMNIGEKHFTPDQTDEAWHWLEQ
jgi:hypothetical protein